MTQRWRNHRTLYRPAGEPIDPRRYAVDVLDSDNLAREFVRAHHYSGTFPAARARVGLFHDLDLVGVAVFSVPCNKATIPAYAPDLEPNEGVELGRFVLLDEVPANGETWFLARAFRLLREVKRDVRMVLSYSDPVERRSLSGELVLPGHVGTIYQAFNGAYLGRSRAETHIVDADGRVLNRRSLSKIRNQERGHDAAYRRLLAAGAPERKRGEDPADYVTRATSSFRKLRHPGNHVYTWAFDRGVRFSRPSQPFPKSGGFSDGR